MDIAVYESTSAHAVLRADMLQGRPWLLVIRATPLDEAMDRYAAGDDQAFALVHEGLHDKLRAFLRRLSGSTALADDLVQETFLRIHRARGTFARQAAVLPWAYAIARNTWLEHARSKRARAAARMQSLDDDPSEIEPPAGPEADAEQALVAREIGRIVDRVLASLPEAQREAFVLLRYEGLSVQEAASIVGATETAMKLRAFRAYEALRKALDTTPSEGGSHG